MVRGVSKKGKKEKNWSIHALRIEFKAYSIKEKSQRKASWRTENTLPPFHLWSSGS